MNPLDHEKQVILPLPVPGLQVVGAALSPWPSPSRLPALQRKQSASRLLMSSGPPWFHRCAEGFTYGMMWSTSRARWCSCAPQHSQRPRAHR